MAGVLSFTLGLEASNFLRQMGAASGQVLSLAAVMRGLEVAAVNVWGAIERGGALVDLSNRTGATAKELFQLQSAFEASGLGADAVAPMLTRMQKALAGVDESGAKTDALFQQLGLDLGKLRGMGAGQQLEAIAEAMGQLGQEQGIAVASRLFGREGAGQMMQLVRDLAGFRDAMAGSAQAAAVFGRNAAAFDTLGDTVGMVKVQLSGLWAGVAEGAAPALQAIADWVGEIDFVGLGQRIGEVFTVITQAFREGKLSELLGVAIETGLLIGFDALPRMWAEAITKATENKLVKGFLNMTPGGAALNAMAMGATGGKDQGSWGDILARGMERMREASAPLTELFGELSERAPRAREALQAPPPGTVLAGAGAKAAAVDGNVLEKMGFVMNGRVGRGEDYARQTADATRTLVGEVRKTNALLARSGEAGGDWANV